jgi:RNA polymerase sigma-70 factor (ECF subfamily)
MSKMADLETKTDLDSLIQGGESALGVIFARYQRPLERMIEFRLDERVRGRVDPEDVLQEAFIEASRRLKEYLAAPQVSFYVWLRQITYQTLLTVQRRHFGQKRDPRLEVNAMANTNQDATCLSIFSAFVGQLTTPSQVLMKQEQLDQLKQVLAEMDEIDREVLALRHFEHLSNSQIAESLGISATAASNRYVRAMTRLSDIAQKTVDRE